MLNYAPCLTFEAVVHYSTSQLFDYRYGSYCNYFEPIVINSSNYQQMILVSIFKFRDL